MTRNVPLFKVWLIDTFQSPRSGRFQASQNCIWHPFQPVLAILKFRNPSNLEKAETVPAPRTVRAPRTIRARTFRAWRRSHPSPNGLSGQNGPSVAIERYPEDVAPVESAIAIWSRIRLELVPISLFNAQSSHSLACCARSSS